jgi:DNA-binding transcriptional LysR family regulator
MEPVSDAAVFVRVVEEGSFTGAATSLELSKGAVSKYVSRLETTLGARLLNRTTRSLTLTEAGTAYFQRASRALEDLRQAAEDVIEQAGSPRGHLRVAAPPFYAAEILAPHLHAFHKQYPLVTVQLMLENRLIDLVEERVDLAIRMSAPEDSSLVMRRIASIPIVVCASPGYLERHGTPREPSELGSHRCLIYTVPPRAHQWPFIDEKGDHYTVHVQGPFELNDDHALRQLAFDGLGLIRMPRLFLNDAIEEGRLVQIWPDDISRPVTLAALYPSRAGLPAKARAFIDFVLEISG